MKALWIYLKNTVFAGLISCFVGAPFLGYYLFNNIYSLVLYDDSAINAYTVCTLIIIYILIGALISVPELTESSVKDYEAKYNKHLSDLEAKGKILSQRESDIQVLLNETKQSYPWTANQIADLHFEEDSLIAVALKTKAHPAIKAAEEVKRMAKEKRDLISKNKQLEYQIAYYETVFPWLEEFKELPPKEGAFYADNSENKNESEYEVLKQWLSPEEYSKLSNAEKYQRALERYQNRKKTDWEIGIEYERFVGYMYEGLGYKVQYHGALMGKQDMGRDLVVTKGKNLLIIQCKRWAKDKTIHEKHIFQLYGSSVQMAVDSNRPCIPVFVTTATLSETAKKCAEYLHIEVAENYEYRDYPLIKCNISKSGEKIYHLPFDQQYDRVQINVNKGEKYVTTVKEAEELGFRRAHRWKGNLELKQS